MLSRLELLVDLLHSVTEAALATHSSTLDGFPFASAVPFVTDEHHRPVFLISGLAEHSRNLHANPRASLMIVKPLGGGETARISLLGEAHRIVAEPLLTQRYLRYHPHAERFLQLGDFAFHRFDPVRALTVGGFAKANWLDADRLLKAPALTLEEEAEIVAAYRRAPFEHCRLRGGDAFGADATLTGRPVRVRFSAGPVEKNGWLAAFRAELATLAETPGPPSAD